VRGFNGGLELGLDYYISPTFSFGVGGFADALILKRPPIGLPAGFDQLPPEQQKVIKDDPIYESSGTSAGIELGAALRLGLHFGL
jgi:hypothetical protein